MLTKLVIGVSSNWLCEPVVLTTGEVRVPVIVNRLKSHQQTCMHQLTRTLGHGQDIIRHLSQYVTYCSRAGGLYQMPGSYGCSRIPLVLKSAATGNRETGLQGLGLRNGMDPANIVGRRPH